MLKVPGKFLKPLDYLFIFRPTLFFPVWIITLAGYSGFHFFNDDKVWWSFEIDWITVLNFFLITLAAGGVFILNQLRDIGSDKDNKKLFLISEAYIPPGTAKKIAIISIITSILLYFLQSPQLFLLVGLFVIFWGYFYNYKPFAWKDLPIMGILTNVIGGLLLFLAGWVIAGYGQWKAFIYVIPYLFAFGSTSLLTTIPDTEGDAIHNKKTFSVRFGRKVTIWTAFIFIVLGFIIGMLTRDPVITIPILLTFPLYIILLFKQTTDSWIFRSIRYPILFIALTLCVEFPLFFLVILVNFYLSKFYYISRFDLDYPTFKIEE